MEGGEVAAQEVVIQMEGARTHSRGLEVEDPIDQVQTPAHIRKSEAHLWEAGPPPLEEAGPPAEASTDQVQSAAELEIETQTEQVHVSVGLEKEVSSAHEVVTQSAGPKASAGRLEVETQIEQEQLYVRLEGGNPSTKEVVTQLGISTGGMETVTQVVLDPWRPTHDTTGDVMRFLTEMRKQSERLTIMEKRGQNMETMIESQGQTIKNLQHTLLQVAGRLDIEPGMTLAHRKIPLAAAAPPVRMPRAPQPLDPQPSDHQSQGSHAQVPMPRSSSPVQGARARLPPNQLNQPNHKKRPTFKCNTCDHKTTNERRMENHIRNFHTHPEEGSSLVSFTLLVGDSHLSSVGRREVERGLGRGARLVTPGASRPREDRAYCSTPDWPGAWFKQNSLQQMVPELLGERQYSNLILMAPTNDITNLQGLVGRKEREALAIQSAKNTVLVAEEALKSVKEVLIMEQPTRADELAELSEFSASKLKEFVLSSRLAGRIRVGSNRSDCCISEGQKTSVFGELSSSKVDGIHMRGKEGRRFLTETFVEAAKVAGLADRDSRMERRRKHARGLERQEQGWSRVVGGLRPAVRVEDQRTSWADVASNRFHKLSN